MCVWVCVCKCPTWWLSGAGLQGAGLFCYWFGKRVTAADQIPALVALDVPHPHTHATRLGALTTHGMTEQLWYHHVINLTGTEIWKFAKCKNCFSFSCTLWPSKTPIQKLTFGFKITSTKSKLSLHFFKSAKQIKYDKNSNNNNSNNIIIKITILNLSSPFLNLFFLIYAYNEASKRHCRYKPYCQKRDPGWQTKQFLVVCV